MSHEKEHEIQMQFLEEATDYLNTLEGFLLEIGSTGRIELDKMNAALRAAHSIKGGAGMMGFRALSDLSHRIEDSFKVLKTKRNSLELDTELQSLLLSGVDWLRKIVERHAETNIIDEQWLTTFCYPVFEQLRDRLGDPTPEDASSILSDEDGQDIIPLLFETEVAGCLERLEALLTNNQQANLKEEVTIMAAELGGLGEMLGLEAFSKLCESVTHHLEIADSDHLIVVARAALETWQRSQAMVLTNQIQNLPSEIQFNIVSDIPHKPIQQPEIAAQTWVDDEVLSTDFEALEAAFAAEITIPGFDNLTAPEFAAIELPEATEFQERDYQVSDRKAELVSHSKEKEREAPENTVRVPSKQLEQINDLFGELIVQRNGLNLQLERFRKLIRNLNQRVQVLERENQRLRTAYDRISTPGAVGFGSSSVSSDSFFHNLSTEANKENKDSPTLNNGFDSLEMDQYNELNLLSQEVMETIVQVQEVTTDLQLSLDDTDNIARKVNKTSKQLQRKLTQVRMRPLSDVVDRFPRALRDLSIEYGKNVQLKISGGNTLIERSILEALNDPLMHLIRNAFDHGIESPTNRREQGKSEQGVIEISATHQGNRTIIKLKDDGRGIALEKIRSRALEMGLDAALLTQASQEELLSLIFEPGFSTSDQVTALSGRGVGMDVVRNNLKQVRGDVTVDTLPGEGTTFTLSVPFTLSVARVLLAESARMLLAFPTDVVEEIFLLDEEAIISTSNGETINWQGSNLPLIRLAQYLEFNCPRYDNPNLETPAAINAMSVLVFKGNNQTVALVVDRTWGEQEVAIRLVEGDIPLPGGFNNCTILGDGRVIPLVNINELLYAISSATVSQNATEQTPRKQLPSTRLKTPFLNSTNHKPVSNESRQKGTILIIDDSINVRRFLALTLEKAGYVVEQAKDGQDALEKLQVGLGLKVQAVICDIEMPRVDGYGFLGRVKSNDDLKAIPVAMLTSRSSEKHRQLAMQLGARAYFSKPYNEQELLRTLEEIIFPVAGVVK
jgi:two-component system, chemotaxis family, sensor histidine kinase and response regulator PixL